MPAESALKIAEGKMSSYFLFKKVCFGYFVFMVVVFIKTYRPSFK